MSNEKTFEELSKDPVGTIYHDEFADGSRFVILRGPVSLCAYLGVPKSHPLAGFPYDDLGELVGCHGGLTFSGTGIVGPGEVWYWYGWDYAHYLDRSFSGTSLPLDMEGVHEWTVKDVLDNAWNARSSFTVLVKLAEAIAKKEKVS